MSWKKRIWDWLMLGIMACLLVRIAQDVFGFEMRVFFLAVGGLLAAFYAWRRN